ncbi:MAG TPA: BamA/TamA family outer membrane protein [Anaeromyxobacteraceae bacterium]|nr:BamA/TamA family outer membrane protein [Anaeromyxobacteraceae bacterium]
MRALVPILLAAALAAPPARAEDPAGEEAREAAVACACSADCVKAFGHGSVCVDGHCEPYHDQWSLLDWVGLAREEKGTPPPFQLLPAVLPAVGYNPAMGLLFGAVGTLGMYLGPASTTTISSLQAVALYSTMSQLTLQVTSTVMTSRNTWELQGDWRFLLFNQKTWGLGTGPQALSAVPVVQDFDMVRVHQTVLRKVWGELYAGVGYRLDAFYAMRDEGVDLASAAPVPSAGYAYSIAYGFDPAQYAVSGATLAALYDSRDSTLNPYRGIYAFASITANPTWLGSSQPSTRVDAQFRTYFPLSDDVPRNVIGVWLYYAGITSGTAPYLALPAIGWDQRNRTGRGYVQGRWRGTHQLYGEAEWRFRITNNGLLGGVVFANAETFAAPAFQASGPGWSYASEKSALLQYVRPAGGIGLRFMMNRDSRSNVALDFAFGQDYFGVWFNAGEYF